MDDCDIYPFVPEEEPMSTRTENSNTTPVFATPFSDCKIAFAVDVSFNMEDIKAFGFNPRWTLDLSSFPNLSKFSHGGAPEPTVLLSGVCLKSLQDASLACLFTQAKVEKDVGRHFAERFTEVGLHETPWNVVFFGSGRYRSDPLQTDDKLYVDESLFLSILSLSSDCVYLYHELRTEELRLVQGKGCFTPLLSGQENPILDSHSRNFLQLLHHITKEKLEGANRPDAIAKPRKGTSNSSQLAEVPASARLKRNRETSDNSTVTVAYNRPQFLYFPGFSPSPDISSNSWERNFIGSCELCEAKNQILALLIKAPSDRIAWDELPPVGSRSPLSDDWSHHVYHAKESEQHHVGYEMVSCCVCCEACAFFVARTGRCQSDLNIIAAFPLVPFATNKAAWLQVLDRVVQGRFESSALPRLYLDFLLWTYKEWDENSEYIGRNTSPLHPTWIKAVTWATSQLLEEILRPRLLHGSPPVVAALIENSTTIADAIFGTIDGGEAAKIMWFLALPVKDFILALFACTLEGLNGRTERQHHLVEDIEGWGYFRAVYHLIDRYVVFRNGVDSKTKNATMMEILYGEKDGEWHQEPEKGSEAETSDTEMGNTALPNDQQTLIQASTPLFNSSAGPAPLVPRTRIIPEDLERINCGYPANAAHLLASRLCPADFELNSGVIAMLMHVILSMDKGDATSYDLYSHLPWTLEMPAIQEGSIYRPGADAKSLIDEVVKDQGMFSVCCAYCQKKGAYRREDAEVIRVKSREM